MRRMKWTGRTITKKKNGKEPDRPELEKNSQKKNKKFVKENKRKSETREMHLFYDIFPTQFQVLYRYPFHESG